MAHRVLSPRFALLACALFTVLLLLALPRVGQAAPPRADGAALFNAVSPAIAYIMTADAAGSGVLFQDGYLLTNAHVVAPHDSARVRFPNGTEIVDASVVAWDWLADLAVLRVGAVPGVQPVRIGDWRDLAVGEDVYLIGYPGEIERRPTPTIARGVVSKLRPGGPAKLSYIETDARASGGASGGAMVAQSGEVVGIVELLFKGTGFTLAIPAREAVDRIRALLRGEDVSGLGDRRLQAMLGPAALTDRFNLPYLHQSRAYLLRPLTDGMVRVNLVGHAPSLSAYDESGALLDAGSGTSSASVEFRGSIRQQYYILAGQDDADPLGAYNISATQALSLITDPDDGKAVTIGGRVAGSVDYPGDIDFFWLDLTEGQTVTVSASSVLFDAGLLVQSPNLALRPLSDSDSGGGLTGLDSRLAFTASRTGRYRIGVGREGDTGLGGYLLSIDGSASARTASGAGRITDGALISSGSATVVFGGGSDDELVVASGCGRTQLRFWATAPGGEFVLYAPAALDAANARWEELFPFGVPADTALVAVCDGAVSPPPAPVAPVPTSTPLAMATATPSPVR